jgi:hypothetical protein
MALHSAGSLDDSLLERISSGDCLFVGRSLGICVGWDMIAWNMEYACMYLFRKWENNIL